MEDKIKNRLIDAFRARAKRLRSTSIIILALIFLALTSGIYIFVFSGNIAINEIQGLTIKIRALNQQTEPIAETAKTPREGFEKLENRINELEQKLDRSRDKSVSNIYLVSTVSTKIGSVLILLFLVQILVSLYRYNIRLSGYYRSSQMN